MFFPFAFIFFSFETHIYFSLLEYDLRRTMTAKPRLRSYRLADEIVQRHRQTPPICSELQRFRQLDSKQTDTAFFVKRIPRWAKELNMSLTGQAMAISVILLGGMNLTLQYLVYLAWFVWIICFLKFCFLLPDLAQRGRKGWP